MGAIYPPILSIIVFRLGFTVSAAGWREATAVDDSSHATSLITEPHSKSIISLTFLTAYNLIGVGLSVSRFIVHYFRVRYKYNECSKGPPSHHQS